MQIEMHGDHNLGSPCVTGLSKSIGIEINFRFDVCKIIGTRERDAHYRQSSWPVVTSVSSLDVASQIGGMGFYTGCMYSEILANR